MIDRNKETGTEPGQSAKADKTIDGIGDQPANTPAAFVPSIGKAGVENKSCGGKKWNGTGQGELFPAVFPAKAAPAKVAPAKAKRKNGDVVGVRAKTARRGKRPKRKGVGKNAEEHTNADPVFHNSIAEEPRVRVVKPIDIEYDVNEAAYKAGDYLDEAASFLRKKPALYLPKNQKAQLGQYIGMVIAYAGKAEIKVVPFKLTQTQ